MENLETKVKVLRHDAIKRMLKSMGARFSGILSQIDTYYHCKEGRLKIREINHKTAELIFYQRPDVSSPKISSYTIQPIRIGQLGLTKKILDGALGTTVTVKKKRELWEYKNTRIHLDIVAQLGKFLELETVARKITHDEMQREHQDITSRLRLSQYTAYRHSYSDLIALL
jgi:predicted adenylyl cyclase CyaB